MNSLSLDPVHIFSQVQRFQQTNVIVPRWQFDWRRQYRNECRSFRPLVWGCWPLWLLGLLSRLTWTDFTGLWGCLKRDPNACSWEWCLDLLEVERLEAELFLLRSCWHRSSRSRYSMRASTVELEFDRPLPLLCSHSLQSFWTRSYFYTDQTGPWASSWGSRHPF